MPVIAPKEEVEEIALTPDTKGVLIPTGDTLPKEGTAPVENIPLGPAMAGKEDSTTEDLGKVTLDPGKVPEDIVGEDSGITTLFRKAEDPPEAIEL